MVNTYQLTDPDHIEILSNTTSKDDIFIDEVFLKNVLAKMWVMT